MQLSLIHIYAGAALAPVSLLNTAVGTDCAPPMALPFLVLVLTLVAFGLVMLCSASSAVALYRRQDAFAYVLSLIHI